MKTTMQHLIKVSQATSPETFFRFFNETKDYFLQKEKENIIDAFWGGYDNHSSNGESYYEKFFKNTFNENITRP